MLENVIWEPSFKNFVHEYILAGQHFVTAMSMMLSDAFVPLTGIFFISSSKIFFVASQKKERPFFQQFFRQVAFLHWSFLLLIQWPYLFICCLCMSSNTPSK
jgi:hypothetical protein